MTEPAPPDSADLVESVIKGVVPRQVRLFAAQGLLPVSREELFRLQTVLSADPDEELAQVAVNSLKEAGEEAINDWLRDHPPEPLILDLVIRVRLEESTWAVVAAHENVSDETLRVLARNAPPMVQDIIITNQVRLLNCLEILDDLRANPKVNQVVLRRVREFEEEFIEKVLAGEEALAKAERISVEEALDALRLIGAHIPIEDEMPYPGTHDPALEEAVAHADQNAFGRILNMSVKEKIVCALKGSREERAILINTRNRLVLRAVLACPKVNDVEVERYASSRSVSDEAIRIISANPRWLRLYPVILALALNPKTPIQTSIRILSRLSVRDVARVSRDRNVNPVIRRKAKEFYERRR
jgi:hypothetical protein